MSQSRYISGLRPDARSLARERQSEVPTPVLVSEKRSQATNVSETAKLLLAGGVAGAISKSATAPLARLTILYQVQTGAVTLLRAPCLSHPAVVLSTQQLCIFKSAVRLTHLDCRPICMFAGQRVAAHDRSNPQAQPAASYPAGNSPRGASSLMERQWRHHAASPAILSSQLLGI